MAYANKNVRALDRSRVLVLWRLIRRTVDRLLEYWGRRRGRGLVRRKSRGQRWGDSILPVSVGFSVLCWRCGAGAGAEHIRLKPIHKNYSMSLCHEYFRNRERRNTYGGGWGSYDSENKGRKGKNFHE